MKIFEVIFDEGAKRVELSEIEERSQDPSIWEDRALAQELMKQKAKVEGDLKIIEDMTELIEEAELLLELARGEDDSGSAEEALTKAREGISTLKGLEIRRMLGGEHDKLNAIISINPGAGGTEAQDWADMLLRMYLRWAERQGFKTEIIDYQPGEEAGIKAATFTVSGDFAYGYLKAEVGVHRLVRISPFDAAKRRHTSFSSVVVYPEIEGDTDIEVLDSEIRVDTYRASGAGGQHINKTDSAVRITHLPTNIVVQCQNERSQHKNRATAMKVLKSRLYEERLKEEEAKMDGLHEKREIAWGSQIRSYVLQPYRMVKDHRTGIEVGNVDPVLDGEINQFIEGYLMKVSLRGGPGGSA